MRSAPSVLYPVGRCAFYAWCLLLLGLLGGLSVLAAWVWSGEGPVLMGLNRPGAALVGALLWLAWAVSAWSSWRRSPQGRLHWDATAPGAADVPKAGAWRWYRRGESDAAVLQGVSRVLDLQAWVLLRMQPLDCAAQWVWVERRSDPARWEDLRRALVAHA